MLDWAAWIEDADDRDERMWRFVTLLLASHRSARRGSGTGLPEGKPDDGLVRATASRLLELQPPMLMRAIALVFRHGGAPWPVEADAAAAEPDLALAAALADELEPLAAAWVLSDVARHALVRHPVEHEHPDVVPVRKEAALRWSDAALAALHRSAPGDLGVFAVGPAAGLAAAAEEPYLITAHWAWFTAARAARRRRPEAWEPSLRTAAAFADRLAAVRPALFLTAAADLAGLQRNLGSAADLSSWPEAIARAPEGPERDRLRDGLLAQRAYNAAHVGDRRRAIELLEERIQFNLVSRAVPVAADDPQALIDWLSAQHPDDRRRLNSLANAARELAVNLMESGRAQQHAEDEARAAWGLAVAELVWEGPWANNGPWAVVSRRALLRLSHDPDAVLDLVEVARRAPRLGLQVNAVIRAAREATRHHAVVLRRIDELFEAEPSPSDRGALAAARAWLTQPGGGLYRSTAEEDALTATRLIRTGSVRGLTYGGLAWWVLARVRAKRGEAAGDAFRAAVDRVARLILNATTVENRLHVLVPWRPLLAEALEFARKTQDVALADLLMESVRRDALGPLLTALHDDEAAPDGLAAAIEDVRAAAAADQEAGPAEPDPHEPPDVRFLRQRSSARAIAARGVLTDRLGALGALADPATLYGVNPAALLSGRTGPTYLLQLLPTTHPALNGRGEAWLYRRLTWTDSDGLHEQLDRVQFDRTMLREPGPYELEFDRAPDVFPPPFVDAFRAADPAVPLRVLVVPMGLVHLFWDALEIDGVPLLARAALTIHSSVTAAAFRRVGDGVERRGSVAAFDDQLPGVDVERAALRQAFPDLEEPDEDESFADRLARSRPQVVALGLHGSDDVGGWGQTKFLPGGRLWTAADALSSDFPPLCVLASCHSRSAPHTTSTRPGSRRHCSHEERAPSSGP